MLWRSGSPITSVALRRSLVEPRLLGSKVDEIFSHLEGSVTGVVFCACMEGDPPKTQQLSPNHGFRRLWLVLGIRDKSTGVGT